MWVRPSAIMAVSADNFMSCGDFDKMHWTGLDDKRAFRLLSVSGSGVLGASRLTLAAMPPKLPGRVLVPVTRQPVPGTDEETMEQFAARNPTGSFIGGQTLVLAALRSNLISAVHLCRSAHCIPANGIGQANKVSGYLIGNGWTQTSAISFLSTLVETWRRP
jgi:dihydrofolate reductase